MAFTGVAVIKQVADNLVRITGLELGDLASGTIALHEATVAPGVRLPEEFRPRQYSRDNEQVSLQDSVQIAITNVDPGNTLFPIRVVKTGTDKDDFTITMTNTGPGEAGGTGEIEIYVRFH
jgi:hypothetical protein